VGESAFNSENITNINFEKVENLGKNCFSKLSKLSSITAGYDETPSGWSTSSIEDGTSINNSGYISTTGTVTSEAFKNFISSLWSSFANWSVAS